jgi:hypothetical protein
VSLYLIGSLVFLFYLRIQVQVLLPGRDHALIQQNHWPGVRLSLCCYLKDLRD